MISTARKAAAACAKAWRPYVCVTPALLCMSAIAQEPGAAGGGVQGIEAYRILWERNIFDPERRPAQPETQAQSPAPRPKQLQLTGVVLSDRRATAFFEGSEYGFDTAARAGDQIDPFRVEAIGIDSVLLTQGEERYDIPVGGGLMGQADGAWFPVDSLDTRASSSSPSPAATSSPPKSVEPNQGPSKTDGESAKSLLERMRERREQELQQ